MDQTSLEYRVRRRSELRNHLGMAHIRQHIGEVDRAARGQVCANHIALRVWGARVALRPGELFQPLDPRVVRSLAWVAVREMQQQKTVNVGE